MSFCPASEIPDLPAVEQVLEHGIESQINRCQGMKEFGIGFDIIVQVTGLAADEIEKL